MPLGHGIFFFFFFYALALELFSPPWMRIPWTTSLASLDPLAKYRLKIIYYYSFHGLFLILPCNGLITQPLDAILLEPVGCFGMKISCVAIPTHLPSISRPFIPHGTLCI